MNKIIHVLLVILFIIVAAIALIMSWYSMMDLATTTYMLPSWLAVLLSAVFDGGAIFLGLITITAAMKGDSAFAAKMFTYIFIAGSMYINLSHAVVEGYGDAGLLMFGAAPVILAIVFEVFVKYLLREKLPRHSRLPNAGFLAWIFETKAAWRLFKLGIKDRLWTARGQLEDKQDSPLAALIDIVSEPDGQQPAIEAAHVQQIDSKPASSDSIDASPAAFAAQLLSTDPAITTSDAAAAWIAAFGDSKVKSFRTALGRERLKVTV